MNTTAIKLALLSVAMIASFGAGWWWRGDRADAAEARQQADTAAAAVQQVNDTRATEHHQAEELAAIGETHEKDRAAAEAVPAAVAAELRDGSLQLRHDLAACNTSLLSQAAASAGQRDAPADLGVTLAGPAIGIGRDADDQLRACQAVIMSDRGA